MAINDTRYDLDITKSQILIQDLIEDNPKDLEITKNNFTNIPKRDIDLNNDDFVFLDDTPK